MAVESTWETVELPILEQIYEREQRGQAAEQASELEWHDWHELVRTLVRLEAAGYISASITEINNDLPFIIDPRISPRGLRSIGAWPSKVDGQQVLLDALQRAIDSTEDPDEKTRLQKVRAAVGDVAKASMAAVVSAAARELAGLG